MVRHKVALLFLDFICIILFTLLAVFINLGKTIAIDHAVYSSIAAFISPTLTKIAVFISTLGGSMGVMIVCILFFVFYKTRLKFGIPIFFTVGISSVLNFVLKNFFERPRPNILRLVEETSYSFPSGHAMNNMALYTMIVLLALSVIKNNGIKFLIGLCSFSFVFLIGLSRIYLGVHYCSDVLGGFLMGASVAMTCYLILMYVRQFFSIKI